MDSSTAQVDSRQTYPQATATRMPVRASRKDPRAVSNRSRALPRETPNPSAQFSAILLIARCNCEARSRSLRWILSTSGRANSTTPSECSKIEQLCEFCIPPERAVFMPWASHEPSRNGRPWQEKCATRYAEFTKRRLGSLKLKRPAAAGSARSSCVCLQRLDLPAAAVSACSGWICPQRLCLPAAASSKQQAAAASSGSRQKQRAAGSSSKQRRGLAADQATSRLQSRVSHGSTQRINPKCAPEVSNTPLLQLSPMPSSIPGDRRVPNRDRPRPVIRRHKHAATKRPCTRRVTGDCVSTQDDVRGRAAVLVDGAAVATRADFVLAVVALMPPAC